MKSLRRLFILVALLLFISANSDAIAEDYLFSLIEGQLDAKTPFCVTHPDCPVVTASLKGTFHAEIKENTIVFSDSHIYTQPFIDFALPEHPDMDSDGTTRSIEFSFNGEGLEVSGTVDSSAFDGPIYKYRFYAEAAGTAGFTPEGFFEARVDTRKCIWPLCGGMFLSAVNRTFTRCADGTWAKECYVAAMDWDTIGFDPLDTDDALISSAAWILQGRIESMEYRNFKNLSVFVGQAAYYPVSNESRHGFFAGLHVNDIVCITWPCFSADEYILNRNRSRAISGIDLNAAGASPEDTQAAQDLLQEGKVLIAAGKNRWVEGPADHPDGYGLSFVADQFYLPVQPDGDLCRRGYEFRNGACLTPFGCEAPLIELETISGVANPVTGNANISYDCVKYCAGPEMQYTGPARCAVHMP